MLQLGRQLWNCQFNGGLSFGELECYIAVIQLLNDTAAKLTRRHTPLSLLSIAADCREADGVFLIVGYPRAGTEFREQKWDDPEQPEIKTESLKYVCGRKTDGWKHDGLKYSPQVHVVVGMDLNALLATGDATQLFSHHDIEGISGCGIWLIADRSAGKPLDDIGVEDCKLVAIEHSYDDSTGRVAGTWIDLVLGLVYVVG